MDYDEDAIHNSDAHEDLAAADSDSDSASVGSSSAAPARSHVLAVREARRDAAADQVRLNQMRQQGLVAAPVHGPAPAFDPFAAATRERGAAAVDPAIIRANHEAAYRRAVAPARALLSVADGELQQIHDNMPLSDADLRKARMAEAAIGAVKVTWGLVQIGLQAATLGLATVVTAPVTLGVDMASEAARAKVQGKSALQAGGKEGLGDLGKAGAGSAAKGVAVDIGGKAAAEAIPFLGPALAVGKGLQALRNAYTGKIGPAGSGADLGEMSSMNLEIKRVIADLEDDASKPALASFGAEVAQCIAALRALQALIFDLYRTYQDNLIPVRPRGEGVSEDHPPAMDVRASDVPTGTRSRADATTDRPG